MSSDRISSIDLTSVSSARVLYEKGLYIKRINDEYQTKERLRDTQAYEAIKLQQATASEIRLLRELHIQLEETAKKREAELNKRNTIFNIASLIIALTSIVIATLK